MCFIFVPVSGTLQLIIESIVTYVVFCSTCNVLVILYAYYQIRNTISNVTFLLKRSTGVFTVAIDGSGKQ